MNAQEAAQLLAHAAAFDNRQPSTTAAQAWAAALNDVPLDEDTLAAVARYYGTPEPDGGRKWIQPHHVRQHRKEIRATRQAPGAGYGPDAPPPELADRPMDYAAVLRRVSELAGGVRPFRALPPGDHGPSAEYRAARARMGTRRSPREAVLAYPDLAQRLTEPPLGYETPAQWTGYIPPAEWGGKENDSRRRRALVEIVEEAYRRDAAANGAA